MSSQKAQWTRRLLWLRRKGIIRFGRVARLPRPVRAVGRRVLGRRPAAYERQLEGSHVPIPDAILDPVWEDMARLEEWLGVEEPLWIAGAPAATASPDAG